MAEDLELLVGGRLRVTLDAIGSAIGELVAGGRRYAGWKAIRVTRSLDAIAGSFEVETSDRWADQDEPWPIREEDRCQVRLGDDVLIDGFVDRREHTLDATTRVLSVSGRDRAAALVDCSVPPRTYRRVDVAELARRLAAPFGVAVSVAEGLELPKQKIVVNPGDTAYQAIERAARVAEVLVVSDGAGGIRLTRAPLGRNDTAIVEGANLLRGSVSYDGADRYARYEVYTQSAGSSANRVRATARDANVRRLERVLQVRAETGITVESARRRADWEARHRAARAETVFCTVLGWRQDDGALWALGALVPVRAPGLGVSGDLMIAGVELGLSDAGRTTRLRLVRPDAFAPEPRAAIVRGQGSKGSIWRRD